MILLSVKIWPNKVWVHTKNTSQIVHNSGQKWHDVTLCMQVFVW